MPTMPVIHEQVGDALSGGRIVVRAGKLQKGELVRGSARHRIQTITLLDQAYCVIEVPLKSLRR